MDIKIDNVLVSFEGFPMLTDLGCATFVETQDDRICLPTFRGTTRYAAPELLEERRDGSWRHVASRASDLWAFGMLCYRMRSNSLSCGPYCCLTCIYTSWRRFDVWTVPGFARRARDGRLG